MDKILVSLTSSISNFKTSPIAALKKSGKWTFADLGNNELSFSVISAQGYKTFAEILLDM